jgi:shikimate 5-dehydrogenase
MTTKKAYVIGTNVSSSLSPAIFEYWFKKYNVNAKYNYKEINRVPCKEARERVVYINLQELAGTNLLEGRAYNIFLLAEH